MSLDQQRKALAQLRKEAGIQRIKVSVAVKDLKEYTEQHQSDDCLLVGFHSQKSNPFREKSSCAIL